MATEQDILKLLTKALAQYEANQNTPEKLYDTLEPIKPVTLENITTELRKKKYEDDQISEDIQIASMLAFVEASYSVINQTTMPTPMYRLVYDSKAQNLEFHLLEGKSPVPQDNSLDITMLDMVISSTFREKMPILFEGKTGIGKTFTVEQFFKTVFPKDNYRILRLNRNMSNVFQEYTYGYVENGLIKIKLKQDAVNSVAGLFIDEVNRGDDNQVLQLQDGYIRLSTGEGGEIGIPIPTLENGKWVYNGDRRPTVVVSAQNPPATKDAKYTSTKRADAAKGNRDLQMDVPNTAASVGASLLLLKNGFDNHDKFLESYGKNLAKFLNVPEKSVGDIDDWISLYAFMSDPEKTYCPFVKSSLEYIDSLLLMSSKNLVDELNKDAKVISQWNAKLANYKVDFSYKPVLAETSKAMAKVRGIVESFKEDLVTRDINKAKKLSDAISMSRRFKGALKSNDPVQEYKNTPDFITVQDVASGFAVTLYDKQDTHEHDPITLVDTVLKEYVGIVEDFAKKVQYNKKFEVENNTMSIYNLAFQHAIMAANPKKVKKATKGNPTPYITAFIGDLGAEIAELKRMESGSEFRKPILTRMISDLTTLAGFADEYSANLEQYLANSKNPTEKRRNFIDFYKEKSLSSAIEPIYLERLPRVLGA